MPYRKKRDYATDIQTRLVAGVVVEYRLVSGYLYLAHRGIPYPQR